LIRACTGRPEFTRSPRAGRNCPLYANLNINNRDAMEVLVRFRSPHLPSQAEIQAIFAYVGIEEKEFVDRGLYRTTRAHEEPEGGTYLRPFFFVALSELEFSFELPDPKCGFCGQIYDVTAVFHVSWLRLRLRLVQSLPRLLLQGEAALDSDSCKVRVAELPSDVLANPIVISSLRYVASSSENQKNALADDSVFNKPTVDHVLDMLDAAKANEPIDPNHPSMLPTYYPEWDPSQDYERLLLVRCDQVMARSRAKRIANELGLFPPQSLHKKYFVARPRSHQIWRHCYEIRLRLLLQVGEKKAWFGVEASGWTRCSSYKLHADRVFPFVIVIDHDCIKRRPLSLFLVIWNYLQAPPLAPPRIRFHGKSGSTVFEEEIFTATTAPELASLHTRMYPEETVT
jgi:hypothetical protein